MLFSHTQHKGNGLSYGIHTCKIISKLIFIFADHTHHPSVHMFTRCAPALLYRNDIWHFRNATWVELYFRSILFWATGCFVPLPRKDQTFELMMHLYDEVRQTCSCLAWIDSNVEKDHIEFVIREPWHHEQRIRIYKECPRCQIVKWHICTLDRYTGRRSMHIKIIKARRRIYAPVN